MTHQPLLSHLSLAFLSALILSCLPKKTEPLSPMASRQPTPPGDELQLAARECAANLSETVLETSQMTPPPSQPLDPENLELRKIHVVYEEGEEYQLPILAVEGGSSGIQYFEISL